MRTRKPVTIFLPQKLLDELNAYLIANPPNFSIKKEYFYYIIHYLITKQIRFKKNEWNSLNLKLLKSITVTNIRRYISLLIKGEFLISNNSYSKGNHSQKYKLNEKYIDGITEIEIDPYSKMGDRILKKNHNKKAHYNRLEPYLKIMQSELINMELDYNNAYIWAESCPDDAKKLSYLTSINQIEDKRFRYFKRNSTNKRLDTNLTNLKSDLRQYIIGDYVSIDNKNSQPFLLGILIDNIINKRDTLCCYLQEENYIKIFGVKGIKSVLLIHQNQEKVEMVKFRMFYDSVLNGNLYDDFIHRYTGDINREDVKQIMFKVLFSKNVCYSMYNKFIPYEDDKKVFTSVYSFVGEIIKALKVKDHSALPIYLQRIESYLFIDCISKELVNNGIIPFTIHDSVIVKTKDQKRTIDIMDRVFMKQIGVIPAYNITNIN